MMLVPCIVLFRDIQETLVSCIALFRAIQETLFDAPVNHLARYLVCKQFRV